MRVVENLGDTTTIRHQIGMHARNLLVLAKASEIKQIWGQTTFNPTGEWSGVNEQVGNDLVVFSR